MKNNKQAIFFLCLSLLTTTIFAQDAMNTLQIDRCYEMAKQNYPLVKQYDLIEKLKEFSILNLNKRRLPQFNMAGQATYQSEVTQLPISLPNINIEPLSRAQYRLFGEVTQSITDLLTAKDQRALVNNNTILEEQKIEIELYKLKERINQLFFGILWIDAQLRQTELLKKDIQSGIEKTEIAILHGIALQSSADNLKAELLKANQRSIELSANRSGFTAMLSLLINQNIDENTIFEKPNQLKISMTINRPEIRLFELQKNIFDVQDKLTHTRLLPQLSMFLQGGVGRPTLNFLSNEFSGYYLGGIRLNWNFAGFYTYKKDMKMLGLNKSGLDIQKDIFLFNTVLSMKQQNEEVAKVQTLIESDQAIISLRESIKNTTKNQLENGTTTTNDYLMAVNAQDQAQQNLLLHQIQLLMAQYQHQTISGN